MNLSRSHKLIPILSWLIIAIWGYVALTALHLCYLTLSKPGHFADSDSIGHVISRVSGLVLPAAGVFFGFRFRRLSKIGVYGIGVMTVFLFVALLFVMTSFGNQADIAVILCIGVSVFIAVHVLCLWSSYKNWNAFT